MLSAGPYNWPAHDLTAVGVATNRVSPGAYRAPGAPPAAFAVETLLDRLAAELRDRPDRTAPAQRHHGRRPRPRRAGVQVVRRPRVPRAHARAPAVAAPRRAAGRRGRRRRARFLAGRPGAGGRDLQAGQRRPADRGHGGGGHERDRERVRGDRRRDFGLAEDSVRVATGDTSSAPYGGVSGGSKVTYTFGRAVERAAAEARERLLDVAAAELEIAPEDLELVDGEVRPVGAPARAVTIADLAAKTYIFGSPHRPIEGYGGTRRSAARRAPPRTCRTSASTARPAT